MLASASAMADESSTDSDHDRLAREDYGSNEIWGGELSVIAMADRASAASAGRRLRSGSGGRRESTGKTSPEPASTNAATENDRAVAEAARAIIAYIPAEIVTAYVAATGIITVSGAKPAAGQWVLMWIALAFTPFTVWTLTALRAKKATGRVPLAPATWPWLQIILASVAFELWAFSLPNTPFGNLSWYRPVIGGVVLIFGTLFVGLIASLVEPSDATHRRTDQAS